MAAPDNAGTAAILPISATETMEHEMRERSPSTGSISSSFSDSRRLQDQRLQGGVAHRRIRENDGSVDLLPDLFQRRRNRLPRPRSIFFLLRERRRKIRNRAQKLRRPPIPGGKIHRFREIGSGYGRMHEQRTTPAHTQAEARHFPLLRPPPLAAAMGKRMSWLSSLVVIEGVLPDIEETIIITEDEDINKLVALYMAIGLENICVNLSISTSTPNIPALHSTNAEENEIEVDDEIDSDQAEDRLSDYNSDKDHALYHNDNDLQDRNPIDILGEKMQGSYYAFKYDDNGKQIVELGIGMLFDNVDHFKDILLRYSIQEDIKLKKIKNDRIRVTVKCNNDDKCSWRLHASTYGDGVTFKVKTMGGVHTCVRNLKGGGVMAKWIANEFKDDYKINQEKSVEELDSALRAKYGINALLRKLYRARAIAMRAAEEDHEKSYANIPKYINALNETNRGGYVKLKCEALDITDSNCHSRLSVDRSNWTVLALEWSSVQTVREMRDN
ncbi:hypothetical protein KSP39_PZI014899 [Platanthera zijinensis]|uniref:Transposase MuDR plant domain-containing protein n=1 Tax=Platanthera zijinensis TaxID=2320716 RepID=A0AAP0BAP3_9ASPA